MAMIDTFPSLCSPLEGEPKSAVRDSVGGVFPPRNPPRYACRFPLPLKGGAKVAT